MMKKLLATILALIIALSVGIADVAAETRNIGGVPVTGEFDPALDIFDQKIVAIMKEQGIPSAVMAVMKDGKIVLSHGYGYSDREKTVPTSPHTLMRVASLTKPFTAAAVKHLIREGKMRIDDKVVAVLDLKPYSGSFADPRWEQITINHLITHRGGWDRREAGDPLAYYGRAKDARGKSLGRVPTRQEIASYMMNQPLQFDPGERYAYSNFGYMLLGLVIEKASGMSYYDYLNATILKPLAIQDVKLGRSLPEHRDPNEVMWYSDPRKVMSVYDPSQQVYLPDGGFAMEMRDANGRLISSASSLVKFSQAYWLRGDVRRPGEKQNWLHTGSLPGTAAILSWRSDGINVAVIFNQQTNYSGRKVNYQKLAKQATDEAAAAVWGGRAKRE